MYRRKKSINKSFLIKRKGNNSYIKAKTTFKKLSAFPFHFSLLDTHQQLFC